MINYIMLINMINHVFNNCWQHDSKLTDSWLTVGRKRYKSSSFSFHYERCNLENRFFRFAGQIPKTISYQLSHVIFPSRIRNQIEFRSTSSETERVANDREKK